MTRTGLHDALSGIVEHRPLHGFTGRINVVGFDADGSHIAAAFEHGSVRIWPTSGQGEPIVLRGHDREFSRAAFSPDGKLIVTTSWDRTARIWRADGQGEPIVLRGHEAFVKSASFSPDGSQIVTASDDHTARIGTVSPKTLANTACEMVGRNFTRAEWSQFMPGIAYRKTCPQWPEDALPEKP